MNIQSAENCKGFSEIIRQFSDSEQSFYHYLARATHNRRGYFYIRYLSDS